MSDYILTFIFAAALTRITMLAADFYIERSLTLSKIFSDKVYIFSLLAGVIALLPASIVFDGVDSSTFYIGLSAAVIALVASIGLSSRIMSSSLGDEEDLQATTVLQRYGVRRFVISWAGTLVMGVAYGFLVTIGQWQNDTSFLTDVPPKDESKIYLYIFGGIMALSFITFWALTKRGLRRLPTAARLRRAVNYAWFTPAVIGLIIALVQNQTRNVTLANRYFIIGVFIWIAVAELWVLINVLPGSLRNIRADKQHFADMQRLTKKKTKSRKKRKR